MSPRTRERASARARVAPLLLGAALAGFACDPPPPPTHNIVLIVVDTLRRDHLPAYGGSTSTPNIDALAARGQVFPHFLASFHQTSMSMGAMFTGRTPSIESGEPGKPLAWNSSTWCGMARFASGSADETCIPRAVPTLPEQLREAGFWTVGIASNQFLYEPSGFGRGFDDWTEVDERAPVAGPAGREGVENPHESRSWPRVNEAVFAALDRRPEDRRLFLYVHYLDVHDYRFHGRSYAESVEIQDHAIGELLAGLEERALTASTTVVFTSDHGERLGEDHNLDFELPNNYGHYGNPSFSELLEVPLIVSPAFFSDLDSLRRTQDVFYLVQEIAGLAPKRYDDDVAPDELYIGEMEFRTYRKGRWQISLRRSDGAPFLYNLARDSDENTNIAQAVQPRVFAFRLRINAISEALKLEEAPRTELSPEDEARLRALGYLQ